MTSVYSDPDLEKIEVYASKAPRGVQELADAIGIKGYRGDMGA